VTSFVLDGRHGAEVRAAAVPLEDLDDDTASEACARGRGTAVTSLEEAIDADRARAADRAVVDELRRCAADDRDVQRTIDALTEGARTPAETMRDTGLSRQRYRAARARLDRMATRLPPDRCARAGRQTAPVGAELSMLVMNPRSGPAWCHRRIPRAAWRSATERQGWRQGTAGSW
jgi:hypothetical protein